jgi:hypothetical protein
MHHLPCFVHIPDQHSSCNEHSFTVCKCVDEGSKNLSPESDSEREKNGYELTSTTDPTASEAFRP